MPLWPFLVVLILVLGWHAWETRQLCQVITACTHEVRHWQELLAVMQVPHPLTTEDDHE